MLTVNVEDSGTVVTLRCAGRIVRGSETNLLCAASRLQGRSIILDLVRVTAIDAAGVGALVSLLAAGTYFKVTGANAQVREVLRMTQVDSIVEICEVPSAHKMIEEDINSLGLAGAYQR